MKKRAGRQSKRSSVRVAKPFAGGYDGARVVRRRPSAQSRGCYPVDEDRLIGKWDRERLRMECMDMRRNNPIVAGVCERFADNVVGAGVFPQAKTSDQAWNDAAEAYWMEWSKIADYRQRCSLRELQRLIVQARLLQGETFHVLTTGGQIQPIEAERVATPSGETYADGVFDGVQVSDSGIIAGYWITQRNPTTGKIDTDTARYIRKEDIIHCRSHMRLDQVRGIPDLAPVITTLRDFGLLNDNTLAKANLDAARAWLIATEDGAAKIKNMGPRNANAAGGNKEAVQPQYEFVEGATTFYLRPGEKAEPIASKTPNETYVPYIEMILRLIGAALSMPSEMLVLDFRQASFSSNKAALAQTYRTFTNWHYWLVETFMSPLWRWRIAKAIKDGVLPPAPVDERGVSQWYRVEWTQPDYSYLDPDSQALNDIYRFALGTASLDDAASLRGRQAEDVLSAKSRNFIQAGQMVLDTNAQLERMGIQDRVGLSHFIQAKIPPGFQNETPPNDTAADTAEDSTP